MSQVSPSCERQFVRRLDSGDKRPLVTGGPRRLVDLASIGAATEQPVAAYSHPLSRVLLPMLFDPAQLAGKVNAAVTRLDPVCSSPSSASRTRRFCSGASRITSSMILSTSADATTLYPSLEWL